MRSSRKHAYIMLTPLNSTFFIVKLGFTGVYIIFLILLKSIDCGYSLEPPHRGGSNEYPQSTCMFWAEIWKKKKRNFYLKFFNFLVVKFSVYMNRFVFVMGWSDSSPGAHAILCKKCCAPAVHMAIGQLEEWYFYIICRLSFRNHQLGNSL